MNTKHLINAYLITSDGGWWHKLSREEQQEYIRENPGSKYAKQVKNRDAVKTPVDKAPVEKAPTSDKQADLEAKKKSRLKRVNALLAANKQLVEDIKPGSPVRKAAADAFRKNSNQIAKDMKNVVPKNEYKAAVIAARADLKGEKPSLKYRLGATAGYRALATAASTAGSAGFFALGGPAAPIALGVGMAAAIYFDVKGTRRLFGYGGKFADHDARIKDRAARKLNNQQAAHVMTADNVDAMSDEQVLAALNNKLAHVMETAELTPEDLAVYGKFKKAA